MIKRAFDIALSIVGLLVLSPLFLIIALAIKSTSKGPVFFRQNRVGRFGKEFRIHKFRTMFLDADKGGSLITQSGDHRITNVGIFLRANKLDELPQLIDVLFGSMSVVGPRPEVPKYVDHYTAEQRRELLSVRPGMTDPASIAFYDEAAELKGASNIDDTYINRIMPAKLDLSLRYVRSRSMGGDIAIIARTVMRLGASKRNRR